MTALLFLSAIILLAALGAVWKARPVHAALLLALSLAMTAVLYLVMGAHFIGLIQFAVYVGAVAVLIVFSLLITRPGDEAEEIERRPRSMVVGMMCAAPVVAVLGYTAVFGGMLKAVAWDAAMSVKELGKILFTSHAPAVIALGVLLTAVMIGAGLLARDTENSDPESNGK